MDIKITDADFERFREFFYRKTGIYFADSKRYFVDKRLIERIKATGHKNFRSYFTFIRFDRSGKEFQTLVNAMTVNETYFFREEYQLRCLVHEVLPEILDYNPSGPIRIWSVPCSTGEEPYSIAIYLLEYWPPIEEIDVEIVASDIDTNVLEKAKKGIYSKRSVKNLPDRILHSYFTRLSNDRYQICADLREAIEFKQINICNCLETKKMRCFDVIFCRNLLIYFDDLSRSKAATSFYDSLNAGGFIFLGHSESMSRICSLFKVRKFKNGIVYQKP